MNNQSLSLSGPAQYEQDILDNDGSDSDASAHPPVGDGAPGKRISSFWRNHFFEVGLIASMALYYVIGNQNLGMNPFSQVNPLFSLPFLLLFAALCWYRLPIALALLPLSLPYYILQKTVLRIAPNHNVSFSLAEITLGVCVLVALVQLFWQRREWPYWLAWRELRDRAGPFLDRKSTRLNSSHQIISYAVFFFKKKKKINKGTESTEKYDYYSAGIISAACLLD